MVNNNTFGKLRCISKPILAVMGTSPKQGKYTLQLALRKVFLDKGYKVGQLGTEGTGFLFNFDEIYPTGYNSTVRINGNNSIYFINKLLSDIELKNPDIIILGTQSQTIHYNTGNLNCYTLKNIELILGSDPDGILLVINPTDTFEYIQRTIINLEVVYESKVIALVLFPINKTIKWSVLGNIYQKVI
ncbi:peptide maturation system protein [Streptobacillus moniliformis]|nr:peptide maturation system protein [Streptobacillus moniliformis]